MAAKKALKKVTKKVKASKTEKVVREQEETPSLEESAFNPYAQYNAVLDEVAKKLSDADTLEDVKPMSTGSLVLDIIEGGGIRPAWYTHFGPEQSAKTTGALLIMASAIKNNVPIVSLRDFEGSTGNSLPYVRSILQTSGVNLTKEQLFGKKDKDGKWEVPPRVRYSASTMGVSFFNWFAAVLRRLPDKKLLDGKWYLVYDDEKQNKHLEEYADKTMPKRYGPGIYIQTESAGLQGLVLIDSYPNMNPTSKDEDEADNSLALQARMFSKNLPRVKGYLASKKFAVVGVNQLRDVPMAMFGPKEAEPGGKALRYNSDVRLRWYPRALSAVPLWPKENPKKKGYEIEPSVTGEGMDRYKYINVKAAKNKLSEPDREGWIRLWTRDADGTAHGIDPVFDTMYYLHITGQLTGKKRSALELTLNGKKAKGPIDWQVLKQWILTPSKKEKIAICKKLGFKPTDLRRACFRQIESGKAEEMFSAMEKAKEKSGKSDDEDDGD